MGCRHSEWRPDLFSDGTVYIFIDESYAINGKFG